MSCERETPACAESNKETQLQVSPEKTEDHEAEVGAQCKPVRPNTEKGFLGTPYHLN